MEDKNSSSERMERIMARRKRIQERLADIRTGDDEGARLVASEIVRCCTPSPNNPPTSPSLL